MYKIKTLNKISKAGTSRFPSEKYSISAEMENPDAILVRSADMKAGVLPETVLSIGRAGAGVNNIPVDKCTEKGIVVFNTPGANANAVKELVICALVLSSRNLSCAIDYTKTLKGCGKDVLPTVEKNKSAYAGNEIKGKKLGVIGLGAIGVMVANDAFALGMEVEGYDPFISIESAWRLSNSVRRAKDIDSLIASSDYITIHAPLSDKTKGLINAGKFSHMKKGVRILNFSRGELVNNADLVKAIETGTVAAYVTDFPADELLGVKNVTCIPHLGASTEESEDNCARMVSDQVRDFLENGNIANSVNFPGCSLERNPGTSRLTIINKNVPNVVGNISAVLAQKNLNIVEMINKSHKDLAYNIIDVEGNIPEEIIARLEGTENIIRVRLVI